MILFTILLNLLLQSLQSYLGVGRTGQPLCTSGYTDTSHVPSCVGIHDSEGQLSYQYGQGSVV